MVVVGRIKSPRKIKVVIVRVVGDGAAIFLSVQVVCVEQLRGHVVEFVLAPLVSDRPVSVSPLGSHFLNGVGVISTLGNALRWCK